MLDLSFALSVNRMQVRFTIADVLLNLYFNILILDHALQDDLPETAIAS